MKIRIAMIWGGKSVEHEVSVISGIQAFKAMDADKYEIIPVYMTKDNDMYTGKELGEIASYSDIPALIKAAQRVIMVNEGGRFYLSPYPLKLIGAAKPIEFDMAFPVVHGTNVEDGALQGYLKTIGVPFVGPDVTASAISMDKFITKAVLKEAGVPVLDARVYTMADYKDFDNMLEEIEKTIGYPTIVKPVNLGSSVGIGIAKDRDALITTIDDAFMYATRIMAERAIGNLREINCAVLGDENEAVASECEEPLSSGAILSYEDKYVSGGSKKAAKGSAKSSAAGAAGDSSAASGSKGSQGSGMANLSRKIPAELTKKKREEIRNLAVRAFKALGCNGVSRIDFMIDEDSGDLYFNEINPIPGSLSFYLWEPVGMSYTELLDRMVELALKRARQEEAITYKFDTNILASAKI